MRAELLTLLLMGSGCSLLLGIPAGELAGEPDAALPDAPPIPLPDAGLAVEGTAATTYVGLLPSGDVEEQIVPADLSTSGFAVLVPGAAAYEEYTGAGTADGHFRIPDAPITPRFLLRVSPATEAPTFYDVAERDLDLGTFVVGRQVKTYAAAGTQLDVDLTNLAPGFVQGNVEIWVPEFNFRSEGFFNVVEGVTTLDETIDWGFEPLVTTADRLVVVNRNPDGTIAQRFSASAMDVANGTVTPLAGAFAAVTLDRSVELTTKISSFHAVAAAAGKQINLEYRVGLHPGGLSRGPLYDYETCFVGLALDPPPPDPTVTVGFPNPDGLSEVASARLHMMQAYALPATTEVRIFVDDRTVAPLTSPMTLEPLVGPVGNLALAGVAIGADTSVPLAPGIGLVLSWDAPAIGSADGYQVTLNLLRASGGATTRTVRAEFFTPQTSISIPASLLKVGEDYAVRVLAMHGYDAAAPRRRKIPWGEASLFSGIVHLAAP